MTGFKINETDRLIYQSIVGHIALEGEAPHTCRLCRSVNEIVYKYYCYDKSCYANPRKKAKAERGLMVIRRAVLCARKLSTIRSSLRKMIKAGLLIKVREKRPDGRNFRGWDWMKVYYPTGAGIL
jgi:hypothetical protein